MSELGLALKTKVFEALSAKSQAYLVDGFDSYTHEEGYFFHGKDIAWYPDMASVYKELQDQEYHGFTMIDGNPKQPDFPTVGGWKDNPWNVHKSVTVGFTLPKKI